jgi:hypothetical protein
MPIPIEYTVGMQYTLRKIPRDVDKTLRQKAKKEGRSLNEIALEALTRGVGIDRAAAKNHELDFAIGSWVVDPEFDESVNQQRQIDPELWK